MKIVSRSRVVYCFDPVAEPALHIEPGELVLPRTEDAFGGQVKSEKDSNERSVFSAKNKNVGESPAFCRLLL